MSDEKLVVGKIEFGQGGIPSYSFPSFVFNECVEACALKADEECNRLENSARQERARGKSILAQELTLRAITAQKISIEIRKLKVTAP